MAEEKQDTLASEQSVDALVSNLHMTKSEVDHKGRQVDAALHFVLENEEMTWTEAEERRVRLKIDLFVLPLVSACIGS